MRKNHLDDCTWCAHRIVYKKAVAHKYEKELCGLTRVEIPHPMYSSRRYCAHYSQENCDCEQCIINRTDVTHT